MGTTIEILAPYLPYKVQVEFNEGAGKRWAVIDTLSQYTAHGTGWRDYDFNYNEITPILKSFDQLCTPLSTGEVPAAILAELASAEGGHQLQDDHINFYNMEGQVVYELHDDWMWIIRYGRGTSDFVDQFTPPSYLVDVLRSLHFAVGLQPSQYIRKEV